MIDINIRDGGALHEQIFEKVKQAIINGTLAEGEKLLSVRELAIKLTVNPNTVQRAYRDLEKEGFIYTVQGRGNFVNKLEFNEQRLNDKLCELESIANELMFMGADRNVINTVLDKVFTGR